MNTTTRSFHPLLALAAAAGLALATAPATADPWYSGSPGSNSHTIADGNTVDLQVRVDGATAPLYFKPGTHDRHYFQAFRGRNYSLVVRNTTGNRIGVLIAVDGLNVVNGERSTLDRHEAMYVLDPWESTEIQGWRSSLDDVRRFVFVDEQRSYAERTGQANGDMGWIRVMAYRENTPQVWWDRVTRPRRPYRNDGSRDERSQLDTPAPNETGGEAPQAGALPEMKSNAPQSEKRSMGARDNVTEAPAAPQAAPGTGWGDRRYDPVRETRFTSDGPAVDHLVLRYEYESGLLALGIEPRHGWPHERLRQRDSELGFARPPRR